MTLNTNETCSILNPHKKSSPANPLYQPSHQMSLPTFFIHRTLAFFAMGVGGLIVAIMDRDDECQKGTRAGLTLSDYLLAQSIWALFQMVLVLALIVTLEASSTNHGTFYNKVFGCTGILFAVSEVARFAFWVVGLVILCTNENNECVAEGNRLGVFTLVSLIVLIPISYQHE